MEEIVISNLYFELTVNSSTVTPSALINGKSPIKIDIKVKEGNFIWDPSNRPLNECFDWTKENEERYGNLTVEWIRVSGNN